MIRRLILIAVLLGLAACAGSDRPVDGGIGGTGAPVSTQVQV